MMTRRNPKADDPNRTSYVTMFVHGDDYDRALAALYRMETRTATSDLLGPDLAAIRKVLMPTRAVDESGYQPNVQRSYLLIRRPYLAPSEEHPGKKP